jgi:lysophospholipase L1-like esterase
MVLALVLACSGRSANVAGAGGMTEAGGGSSARGAPLGVSKPRVMIVGDSISAGPGCYKKYLLRSLTANRYSRFEFVGEYADPCGSTVRHSAVSCSTAAQFTGATFTVPHCAQGKIFPGLSTLMSRHHPDVVLLQLGVNDVWGGQTTEQTLDNYQKLVEQARAQNPRVVVVVAQIQKFRPSCGTDDSVQKRAEALVAAVPAWAQKFSRASSPIYVADLWTNSDWSMAETTDCVHPNDAGAQRMALNWFNALKSILQPD